MDISSLKNLLAVNGLTPTSSIEDIRKLLESAKYSQEEIATALTLLGRQDTASIPNIPVAKSVGNVLPVKIGTSVVEKQGIAAGSEPQLFEKIVGPILAFLVYGIFILYILSLWDNASSRLFLLFASPIGWLLYAPAPVILFVASWFIARATNRSATIFFQLSTFLSVYALLWFALFSGLFSILAPVIGSRPLHSHAIVIGLLLIIALPLTILFWRRKKPRRTIVVPTIISLIAICALVYFSGALTYPARALKLDFLCVAVAKSMRESCQSTSYTAPTSSAAYDTIQTAVPLKAFTMIDGHLYALSETGGGGARNDLYIDGVRDTRYKAVREPILDIAGKAAFEAVDVATNQPVLVIGDEIKTGYIGYGSLTSTKDGNLAYVGVKADRSMVVVMGDRILGTSLGIAGVNQNNGLVVLPNGSVLYSFWKKTDGVSLAANTYIAIDNTLVGGPYTSVYLFEKDGKAGYSYTEGDTSRTVIDGKEVAYIAPPKEDTSVNEERLVRRDDGFYLDEKYVAPSQNAYAYELINGKFIIGGINLTVPPHMVRGYMTPAGFIIVEKGLLSEEVKAQLASFE